MVISISNGRDQFYIHHISYTFVSIYSYLYKCTIRVTSGYPNDTFYGILALGLPKFGHLNGRAIFLLWTKDWKWILVANWPLGWQVLAPIVLSKNIFKKYIYLPFCNVTIMTIMVENVSLGWHAAKCNIKVNVKYH